MYGRPSLLQRIGAAILGMPTCMVDMMPAFNIARLICMLLVACLSAWIAVSSILLWGSTLYPGRRGIWEMVLAGAPPWVLVVPLLSTLALVMLAWPRAGKFVVVEVCATALLFLILGAGLALEQGNSNSLNLAAGLCVPAVLLLGPPSLVLALTDMPAPDSLLARVAQGFSMRVWHQRRLLTWGRQRQWTIQIHRQATVGFEMSAKISPLLTATVHCLCAHPNRPNDFTVRLTTARVLRQFYIGPWREPMRLPAGAVGLCVVHRQFARDIYCFVAQDANRPFPPELATRVRIGIERGLLSMQGRSFVYRVPDGVKYVCQPRHWMPLYPGAETITWLAELAALMEMPNR